MTYTTSIPYQSNGYHLHSEDMLGQSATNGMPDEFDSPEFESKRESLPYLQVLSHQIPDMAGFFISKENMEAVNFTPADEWVLHTAVFQSGDTAEGYRSLLARFLVLRKSKLLMFERESGEFLGQYRKGSYDRNTMLLKTRHLVYLVGKDKQLLHDSPLLLTTKGAFSGSFGDALGQFQREMSKAYGIATGARKPRGESASRRRGQRFMALSVFAVKVQPELKGRERKSWTCSVAEFGIPTAQNWRSYFVGYDKALKERLLREFEEWEGFGTVEREVEAQSVRSRQTETNAEHYQTDYADFDADIPPYEEL